MSQNEPKINPATGYVHDDSQLEEKPDSTGYLPIESVDELPEEKAAE